MVVPLLIVSYHTVIQSDRVTVQDRRLEDLIAMRPRSLTAVRNVVRTSVGLTIQCLVYSQTENHQCALQR